MLNRLTIVTAVFALLAQLSASGALAAGLHVEESAVVDAPPAAVWKVIGNFIELATWHPAVARTALVGGANNEPGAVRSIETKDGAIIVEELLAYDAGRHSMRYQIMESPLPVRNYVSTLRVVAAGTGSRVAWASDFDAVHSDTVDDAKAREIVAGIYQAGFEGLRARLGEK